MSRLSNDALFELACQEYVKNHPNENFTPAAVIDFVMKARPDLHLSDPDRTLRELGVKLRTLVATQSRHWKLGDISGTTFYYLRLKAEGVQDIVMACKEEGGAPLSLFNVLDKPTRGAIRESVASKVVWSVVPGSGSLQRGAGRTQLTSKRLVVHGTVPQEVEVGATVVVCVQLVADPDVTMEDVALTASCPKAMEVRPYIHAAKPGEIVRFEIEGKSACECVLRVTVDHADCLSLPFQVRVSPEDPSSILYAVDEGPRGLFKMLSQSDNLSTRLLWHAVALDKDVEDTSKVVVTFSDEGARHHAELALEESTKQTGRLRVSNTHMRAYGLDLEKKYDHVGAEERVKRAVKEADERAVAQSHQQGSGLFRQAKRPRAKK